MRQPAAKLAEAGLELGFTEDADGAVAGIHRVWCRHVHGLVDLIPTVELLVGKLRVAPDVHESAPEIPER